MMPKTQDRAAHAGRRSDRPRARGRRVERQGCQSLAGRSQHHRHQARLCRRRAPRDPYAGFEARVIPENITLLPKTTARRPRAAMPSTRSWSSQRRATASRSASCAISARRAPRTSARSSSVLGPRSSRRRRSKKVRSCASCWRRSPARQRRAADPRDHRQRRLRHRRGRWLSRTPAKYVAVDVRRHVDTEVADNTDDNDENDTSGVRLLSEHLRDRAAQPDTSPDHRRPDPHRYSVRRRFPAQGAAGDSFEVLYAGEEETPAADSRSDVLFATLTVGGETKRFYRFQSPDDGLVDYYDETGKSAKKFLVRKPVLAGIMRSGFGLRRHPILGYTKMHTGVDWAAPSGTPIYASGNGVIEKVGWEVGLRQIHPRSSQQRLRNCLRTHDRIRTRDGRRHARAPGSGDRVCRIDRSVHWVAPALRDSGQWPLRRSDAHQAAARSRA